MDIVTWYYRVDPRKIVWVKSMLEGYEGLVVVRTADPKEGVVELLVSPSFTEELKGILDDLSGFGPLGGLRLGRRLAWLVVVLVVRRAAYWHGWAGRLPRRRTTRPRRRIGRRSARVGLHDGLIPAL